jgi:hypothetical protein
MKLPAYPAKAGRGTLRPSRFLLDLGFGLGLILTLHILLLTHHVAPPILKIFLI